MNRYDNAYHHTRNYGCRWAETTCGGYRALALENELLRLTILLDKGSDIVELLYKRKDIDFMWRSPLPLEGGRRAPVTRELDSGSVLDDYEGGWQELLPSISTPTNYKGMGLGFHGELFSLPWDFQVLEDTPYLVRLKLFVRMRRAPLFVTKILTLRSDSPAVEFEETVRNEAEETFQFMWGQHPAIGKPFLDERCLIDLPRGAVGQTYQVDFSGNSPFRPDQEFDWPFAEDRNGVKVDLSRVMPPERKTAFNIYIKNLSEGWYAVTNPGLAVGFGMKWDIGLFKYLLLWSVCRGMYGFPFYGRTYSLALEPYSAIPDSLDEVIRLGRALSLEPQAEIRTNFSCLVYETSGRVAGFTDDNQIIPG